MRVVQINSVANSGSTGRIAEEIGNVLIENGHESYIAFGRGNPTSNSSLIRIGATWDNYTHGAYTLLTDKHGFASKQATKEFLKELDRIQPDVIGLHNLHGYYLNLPLVFDWIKSNKIPVLWTLFDCWSFTGHCSYFDDINCEKWKPGCHTCPKHKNYPSSWVDNSRWNFNKKKELFTSLGRMELLTHSQWLSGLVRESFLGKYKTHVTPSGINLDLFRPTQSKLRKRFDLGNKKVLLGCASTWSNRKGYLDFIMLDKIINREDYQIVMIGLNDKERKGLPKSIIGIQRTESIEELAQWYTLAAVFVNPTSQDNFPTTNLEALGCGTPVVTYDTGGSPEAIDETTGRVVEKGNVYAIAQAIKQLVELDYDVSQACRNRAESLFDRKARYIDYVKIFERIVDA